MYQLSYDRRIEKDLRLVPLAYRRAILEHAALLADEPRRRHVEKLEGRNSYRLRVGDYRILFTIDDARKIVTIYRVRHRREAYR